MSSSYLLDAGHARVAWLKPDTREWDAAWAQLGPDPDCRDTESGEAWQYLGTWHTAQGWVHEFRHRRLPATLKREYRRFPVTEAPLHTPAPAAAPADAPPAPRAKVLHIADWHDFGGSFDGVRVSSDADPGL